MQAIRCVKPRQESKEDWRREGERKRVEVQKRAGEQKRAEECVKEQVSRREQ